MLNKNGQVSDTITWTIATLIIIVILLVTISIVQFQFSKKKFELAGSSNLLISKSFAGYLMTDGVYENIKKENVDSDGVHSKIPKKEADLARNIFSMYAESGVSKDISYKDIWLGVVGNWCKFGSSCQAFNNQAGRRGDVVDMKGKKFFYSFAQINDKSFIELLVKLK